MSTLHDSPPVGQGAFLEQLECGVTLEWIEGGQIVIYRPPDGAQNTLEALFTRADNILRGWPAGKPHLVILDFQGANILPTPYVRERGRAMWSLRQDVFVATAMVLTRTVTAQFLKVVTARTQSSKALMTVHFSREEAIDWLRKVANIG